MLIKIRIAFALFFFIALTLLFLDFTGTVHTYLGWSAKIQLVPALLATHIAISLGIILITLLLGRVYCSVICPLGIFQDIVSRLARFKNKARFFYKKPRWALVVTRYVLLAVFGLSLLFGVNGIVMLLEPYSAFGRMVSQILGPIYKYKNNLLAYFAERFDSYAFYSVDIWLKSSLVLAVAVLTFAIIFSFAYKSGRGYCNSICPVGAFLGLLAKFSLIKPRIDNSKCTHCGLCAKKCKSSCIDASIGKIDYERCVACFNCVNSCSKDAISYSPSLKLSEQKPEKDLSNLSNNGLARRNLLSGFAIAILGCAAKLQAREGDGGFTALANKKAPERANVIVPPGAGSISNFHKHCTSCQLCVSVCPNQVLRPYKTKPHISYERGYCRPECVKCSEVCPTGAIKPITRAEKSATQIGYAVWRQDFCIINTDKVSCDTCARKCPAAAIIMVPQKEGEPALMPIIDTNRCIGCGACEQLCPARPNSAIYVEGIKAHRVV